MVGSIIKRTLLVLLVYFKLFTAASNIPDPVVETSQGTLEGLNLISRNGIPYYAFKGIRYAEYPGRFEVARAFASWKGVKPAKEFGSVCAQIGLFVENPQFTGEEDCLFMNIYTPTLNTTAGLPVLFWIHGGGFVSFTGNTFEGKYYVDENVILVSFNYRLGPLGFMYFGDNEISGNIGLKDQLLGLSWVKENIKSFGGDPAKITVGGYSAGGASAHFHILSPKSKGLFRSAISHSGTALAFWAIQQNPRGNAVKLASVIGCPTPTADTNSTKDTVACLKAKAVEEVVLAQSALEEWIGFPVVKFGPVVEENGDDSFLTEKPQTILQNGNFNKVNWMTGVTEDDGIVFSLPIMLDQNLTNLLDNDWFNKVPIALGYQHVSQEESDAISKNIREYYLENFDVGDLTWPSITGMFTDRYFLEPCEAAVRLQSQHSRVFPFVFRFAGQFSLVNSIFELEGDHGICHGDDLQYLFPGGSYNAPEYSDGKSVEIVDFSKKFVKLWSSFIYEMKPTATWEKQRVWKSAYHVRQGSQVSFYEIAIETSVWDEDLLSRLKAIKENIPAILPNKKTIDEIKTEL